MPDATRYDDDFLLWTQEQARLLRAEQAAHSNVAIDWENLAEEIESLGKSQQRELESRLVKILEHLLKLAASPAVQPRNGWIDTVVEQRREITLLLTQNPSLKSKIKGLIESISQSTRDETAENLNRYGKSTAATLMKIGAYPEVEERVLEKDFIPHPPVSPATEPPTSTSA